MADSLQKNIKDIQTLLPTRKTPPDKSPPPDRARSLLHRGVHKSSGHPWRASSVLLLLSFLQLVLLRLAAAACTMDPPNSPDDYTYNIGTGTYSFTIADWTLTDCDNTSQTIAITPTTETFVSLTDRTVSVTTTDTSLDGSTYDFTVTATLVGGTADGLTESTYTFKIIMADPCITAILQPSTLSTFTVVSGTTGTADFTDTGDSVGQAQANTLFCGTRTFSVVDEAS